MNKIFLILILWFTVFGCHWENEESFYPESKTCDTLSVSFSTDIVPILTTNCLFCHSNVAASQFADGITLEDYEDVTASSSLIVGAINHLGGFSPMPKNHDKLDPCLINIIEAWVNQGSQNN